MNRSLSIVSKSPSPDLDNVRSKKVIRMILNSEYQNRIMPRKLGILKFRGSRHQISLK
jgi:hypothetical protein